MNTDTVTIPRSTLVHLVTLAELTEDTNDDEEEAVAIARQVLADGELLYDAWGIIAAASDWSEPDSVWVKIARHWRDRWEATLPKAVDPQQ